MKLSDLTPEQWFGRLNTKRQRQAQQSRKWWEYVDLEQPLHYVARILLEQGDKFPPLLINWPQLVVDTVVERLTVEGFRLAGEDAANQQLRAAWQASNLDEAAPEAHTAAMVTGRSYAMLSPREERLDGILGLAGTVDHDYPLVTVEYDDQVAVETHPLTGRVVAALYVWRSDPEASSEDRAVLMLPGRFVEFELGQPVGSGMHGGWSQQLVTQQQSPLVPVVPMLHRSRRRTGRSDLVSLKPIVDAANSTATNMLAAVESHSVPRRWAVNVSENDFRDERGRKVPLWRAALQAVWAIPPPKRPDHRGEPEPPPVQLGQFTASDLRNFHETHKLLATIAASLYGLPPNYMGYSSDNPVSAEAIAYSNERLVRRCEAEHTSAGGTWESAARVMWSMMGEDPQRAAQLETIWRNPATPTLASKADAAVKLFQVGLIDDEQAWEDIGYTEGQKAGMRERRRTAGGLGAIVQGIRELDVGPGVTQPALPPAEPGDGDPGAAAGAGS